MIDQSLKLPSFSSLTESSCAHTLSPSVKSKIFLECSVLFLFRDMCFLAPIRSQNGGDRFGTGLVRHCPQGLFSPFFTFVRVIFFRPFRLSLVPTICPWVSEDASLSSFSAIFICVIDGTSQSKWPALRSSSKNRSCIWMTKESRRGIAIVF